MNISDKNTRILKQLINGVTLPASSAKTKLINELIQEKIILLSGKHRKTIQLRDVNELYTYFTNQYQINLSEYLKEKNKLKTRADFVKLTSDSKDSRERVFKGFLINSVIEISAILNGENITINPPDGSFIFIYDYENFVIDENILIVGVENSLNFRHIREQSYLFTDKNILFISRYPQNQSKDFIKWMLSIPNNYLHFGDFDIAGIGIYMNEYKKYLGKKAHFFIPGTIENDLKENGNNTRYDIQKQNFKTEEIDEPKLLNLVKLIYQYKKGLDQEFYISKHNDT